MRILHFAVSFGAPPWPVRRAAIGRRSPTGRPPHGTRPGTAEQSGAACPPPHSAVDPSQNIGRVGIAPVTNSLLDVLVHMRPLAAIGEERWPFSLWLHSRIPTYKSIHGRLTDSIGGHRHYSAWMVLFAATISCFSFFYKLIYLYLYSILR